FAISFNSAVTFGSARDSNSLRASLKKCRPYLMLPSKRQFGSFVSSTAAPANMAGKQLRDGKLLWNSFKGMLVGEAKGGLRLAGRCKIRGYRLAAETELWGGLRSRANLFDNSAGICAIDYICCFNDPSG